MENDASDTREPFGNPRTSGSLRVFALAGSDDLGRSIARNAGWPLGDHEDREFEDGEHKARPLTPVQGADCYVIHSLYGDRNQSANDKLCRMLFFIQALKDAGARRVTAITPYLCYARKDRRTKTHDPVTTRYVAQLFEAMGTDGIVTLDIHNDAAFENAFRCRTVSLTTTQVMVAAIQPDLASCPKLSVVTPDLGGGKRAKAFLVALESALGRPVSMGFAEKHRSGGIVSGDLFAGDVRDATCILIDDLISTGGTLVRAAKAARAAGARHVLACATHGLFMPGAETSLADPAIDRILVTDTVPTFRLPSGPVADKLTIVSTAELLAQVIDRLHCDRPLFDLGAN